VYKVHSLFKSHDSFDSFFNIKQYRISAPFRATRFAPRCVFLIFNLFPSASSKDVRADSGRSHTMSDSGRHRESSSDICRRAFVLNMFIPFLFLGTTALLSTLWSLCRALAPFYMFHLQLGILLQNNEWLARYISHTNSKVFFVNSKND